MQKIYWGVFKLLGILVLAIVFFSCSDEGSFDCSMQIKRINKEYDKKVLDVKETASPFREAQINKINKQRDKKLTEACNPYLYRIGHDVFKN